MQIFNSIMNHEDYENIRKEVLIQFGFNSASPTEIVNWFEAHYPDEYEWIVSEIEEKGLHNDIKEVVPKKVQLMGKQDRNNLLNVENDYSSETRARYVQVNHDDWKEIGQDLKQQREELGLGITKLAEMLGTSASRIRNFEQGLPVQMSKHLEQCYKLALDREKTDYKFRDERYEKERLENILFGFIGNYNLNKLFEQYLLDLKQEQNDPNDEYEIAKELYGDLDRLIKYTSFLFSQEMEQH